jgi:hypothetical protein
MPPESCWILASRFSQSDRRFSRSLEIGVVARLAEEAAREADGVDHRREDVEMDLLRHEADHRAGAAELGDDVVPADRDPAHRSSA